MPCRSAQRSHVRSTTARESTSTPSRSKRKALQVVLTRRLGEETFGEIQPLFDFSQSPLQRIDGLAQLGDLCIRRRRQVPGGGRAKQRRDCTADRNGDNDDADTHCPLRNEPHYINLQTPREMHQNSGIGGFGGSGERGIFAGSHGSGG